MNQFDKRYAEMRYFRNACVKIFLKNYLFSFCNEWTPVFE